MSDDANPSAAAGGASPPRAHPYAHALRLHRGARGFVALCCKAGPGGRLMDTRCFQGPALFSHLPAPDAAGEHFISVNTFKKRQRTIANVLSLRANFLDLDFRACPAWADATAEKVWAKVQTALAARAVPLPTMVVASGRGIHVYWNFPEGLPKDVLPRWNAVQAHLCELLKPFGADPKARDAARILRLAGTINAKTGTRARPIHIDYDRGVDFEDLARAVLPLTQHQLRERKQQRSAKAAAPKKLDTEVSNPARQAQRAYAEIILADIDRLVAYRWGGLIPEGHRNQALFVRGCFMVHVVGAAKLERALVAYGLTATDLEVAEILQIVGSIVKKIVEDGRGYRYATAGAAHALGITVEEVRAAGLVRLHPADSELAEERRQQRLQTDRGRKMAQRRAAGIPPRKLRRDEPWKALGISRSTWYAKYYRK